MSRLGVIETVIVLVILAAAVHPGTAQFQTCYDNAVANCGGNVISGASTAQDCCLGDGFWFRDPNLGGCVQCIVHGFERSMVSVDEGDTQLTLNISLDIKGNTLDEPQGLQVTRVNFAVVCEDVTTESDDYSSATCDSLSVTRLDLNDPEMMDSEVRLTFQADNRALEGIEELRLGFRLERDTQNAVTISGNIFFQNTSIQINDTTALRPTFSQVDYEGNEGPDRGSNLDAAPCAVLVRLEGTIIEEDLAIRLIPRTLSENIAVNGPPPTAERLGFNASRADFNDTQPFEITIPAGMTAVPGDIPIVNDDINEGSEDFVVVLEVASNTTNPVDFSGPTQTQTTVCRIPANDPIEIGFRNSTIQHNEEERQFMAILEKDRPSELEYVVDIVVSTPNTGDGRAATPDVDFGLGNLVIGASSVRVAPTQNRVVFAYQIFQDNIPENTELIQVSSSSNELPTFLCDDDPMFRFNGRDCFRDLQIQILDDDVVVVGFVETLVEVNESDGRATLNVSISFPAPDPLLQFEIEFTLLANTVDGSAGSRPTTATRRDPRPGIEDYQQRVSIPLSFRDAQRSQTFDVEIFEDEVPEGVEELNVTLILDPASIGIVGERVSVTPAVATVRILDNDSIVVGFERTIYVVDETDGQVELCVNVTLPENQNINGVTFNLTVETQDGTAMGSSTVGSIMDADYISVNTTLATFTDDQTRQCFNVTIVDDTEVELTEDFFASLTLIPASVTTIDPSRITVDPAQATVNIIDNDLRITVGYVNTAVSVSEGAGVAELTVAISVPDSSVTIDSSVSFYLLVNTINGTATAPGDYGALTGFRLGPFSNSVRQLSFNVSIVNDMIPEDDEVFTASLTLSPADQDSFGNLVTVDPDLASVTILDDEVITVGYVQTDVSVSESAGVAQLTVNISVPPQGDPIETSFTLLVNMFDGTAAAPGDYGALTNFSLGPFSDSVRELSFNVSLVNDMIPEGNETFIANLTLLPADQARLRNRVTVQPDSATVTILDDDAMTIGIEEPRVVNVIEGVNLTVEYCVVITAPSMGTTIERDDFFVCVSTVDGTAVAGEDYGMVTNMRLGPFGNSNRRQCFTVNILNDTQSENTENFMVDVSFCPGEPVPPRVDINPRNATTVIIDDDGVVVGFERTSYLQQENVGQFQVCVVVIVPPLSETLNRMFSLSVSTRPGTADNSDYTAITNQIVGPFSNSRRQECFLVEITDDTIPENSENFFLDLAPPPGEMLERVAISPSQATVTIEDDELIVLGKVPPLRVTVTEGVNQIVECCVQITGPDMSTTIQRDDFSVCVSTINGTAVAGTDFNEVTDMVLGPFGNNNRLQCFNVTVVDDDVPEEIEEFMTVVTFCPGEPVPPNTIITPPNSTVVIEDNDGVVVGFERTSYLEREDVGQFQVCVVVTTPSNSQPLDRMFSLSVSTRTGTADNSDYTAITNQIVGPFSNSRRQECFLVEITDDTIPENSENFFLDLAPPPGETLERVTITPSQATVTIEDDDLIVLGKVPPLRVTVTEGVNQTVECCVQITGPDMSTTIQRDDFSVCVSTISGTAVAGTDFNEVMNMRLGPFGNSNRLQCFNVTVIDDNVPEEIEEFMTVVTFCPGEPVPPNTQINPPNATTTIFDRITPAPPAIRVNDTVTGDPLMTVPLNVGNSSRMLLGLGEGVSLCYEVHGEANENFNLVSDMCVSVNAHYMRARSDVDINVIDTIGVRAVGNDNQCRNIQVDLDGCRASVNGVEITMPYRMAGISVRKYTNRVRIAVPNCDDHDLVMWVFCQTGTFGYNDTSTFQAPMIRFVIARGFNLQETSHGILGQFWNIPIDVGRYNQSIDGTVRSDTYTITVNYPGQTRQFVGFLYPLTWEFDERQCLYVGNGQGGPIDEVADPNDPVLQGEYTDYIVDDLLDTDFEFTHFQSSRCTSDPTTTPA